MQQFDQAPVPADVPDRVTALEGQVSTIISVDSLAALESRLIALCEGMSDAQTRTGYARLNFTDTLNGFYGGIASAILSRRTTGVYIANILQANGRVVSDYYYSNAHHYGCMYVDLGNYITNGVQKQISSGSANDIITPGRYYVTSAVTDLPNSGDSGYLDVYVYSSSRIAQTFRPYSLNTVYERRNPSGTWGSWEPLAYNNNIEYNANTDRTVESNRTTAMEYLYGNGFSDGRYRMAVVRYASGYYHSYIAVGTYSGRFKIIEVTHNIDDGIIYWERDSSGVWSKHNSALSRSKTVERQTIASINNSSITITFTGNAHFLLICEGSATARQGVYMIRGQTSGSTVLPITPGSAITVTVNSDGNAITVSSNQSGQIYLYAMIYDGTNNWTVT